MPNRALTIGGVLLTNVSWDCAAPDGNVHCSDEFTLLDKWDATKKKEEQTWYEKWLAKLKGLFSNEEQTKDVLTGLWNGLQGEASGQLVVRLKGIPEIGECVNGKRGISVTVFAHVQITSSAAGTSGNTGGAGVAVGADFKVTLPYDGAKFPITQCDCTAAKTLGLLIPGNGPFEQVYVTAREIPRIQFGGRSGPMLVEVEPPVKTHPPLETVPMEVPIEVIG